MCKYTSVMYVCVYVCTYIVYMHIHCTYEYSCMCVYLCTYIVHMNVAMYVCNPSDMLQAQPDGTKVFKYPHVYYCHIRSGTKNTVILCVGLVRRTLSPESSMTRHFVKYL